MGNYNDFDLDIKKVQGENDIGPASITTTIRDDGETLIRIRNPDIFCLTAVNSTPQCPAAVGIGAVVDISVLAEETCAAEGLHVDRHPVTRFYCGNFRADRFHNANHFVTDRNARDGSWNCAVLNMQVTGANAGEGYPDNRVSVMAQDRFRLLDKAEFSRGEVRIR